MAKNVGGTMVKTAEQMNQERRLVKARQQANAKARAVHKSDNAGFDLREAQKERRRFAIRQQRAKENGQRLLTQLQRQGVLRLQADLISEDGVRIWLRNCRDVIAAAKADSVRYVWNKDWETKGDLMIALPKSVQKPAVAVA